MVPERESKAQLLLVKATALPEVYAKVVDAKGYLQSGEAATAAEAARLAGISRTAFYKYKDAMFPYDAEKSGGIVTVHMLLRDSPGVLSALLAAFADAGANILTVNQNIPAGGTASVSISARTDRLLLPLDAFVRQLAAVPGVKRISQLSGDAPAQTTAKKGHEA